MSEPIRSSGECRLPEYIKHVALRMKITAFLLLAGCLHLSAASFSQQVTLTAKRSPLAEVLAAVQQQTSMRVIYNDDYIVRAQPVTIAAKDMPLERFLEQVLAKQSLTFALRENTIIIGKEKNPPTTNRAEPALQEIIISGKVTDESGSPLQGITVSVKGTTIGIITDEQGNYQITVPPGTKSLSFSGIGFKDQDVEVGKEPVLNVAMVSSVSNLEEVVVVGFGSQKRASVIGAISTVDPELFKISQSRTVTNNLAGQMAGIIAVQRSGEPGDDASAFWIRGLSTFSGGTSPLVLVDGVERSLSDISPDEIASFSILKDATATAVYGVRGANGVILIQTPKGKVGKPRVSVRTEYGISSPTQLPKFIDGAKYMEVINEARLLSGLDRSFSDEAIELTRSGADPDFYPNVNWLESVTENHAFNQRLVADVNGGSERLRYSLVVSQFGERGITVIDPMMAYDSKLKLSRFNVRSNVDVNLSPSTIMNVSIGGFQQDRNLPGGGVSAIFDDAFVTPPILFPIRYSNGQLANRPSGSNPWGMATQTGFIKNYQSRLESTVSVQQDLGELAGSLKGFNAKALFAFDTYNFSNINRVKTPSTYQAYGRDADGNLQTNLLNEGQEFLGYSRNGGGSRAMYFETQLNYNAVFGEHTVGGLLLFNLRDRVDFDASNAIASLPYRNQGVAGRLAYNYGDRYFVEANFGYNGSENFQRDRRYGFFPSIALGWQLINEAFMSDAPYFSNLKLRGSWGLVGNDNIGGRRFAYLATIGSAGGYNWGYQGQTHRSGWQEEQFGVPNLTWETAEKLNAGVEIGLWNAVNLQVDLFKENRRDIFMQRQTIPEIAGYNQTPYANFGKVDNRGIDMSLEAVHRFSDDFSVAFRGNYTFARNKVLEIDEPEKLKATTRAKTGQSLNLHYGLQAIGLFQDSDFENGVLDPDLPQPMFSEVRPGDIRYEDINNDGLIDAFDQAPIGRPWLPEIVYGFGTTLRYKGIDLGLFFQGASNFTNMIGGDTFIPGSGGGALGNIYANVDDRWLPENPNNDVFWPRLSIFDMDNNKQTSTWWLRDASYLRLKNVELGWSLPQRWVNRMSLGGVRLVSRGTNLLTWAPFKMWDPELGSSNGLTYPAMRVFSFGLELTF